MVSAEKAREAGMCEPVMKPIVKKELAETIRRVMDSKTCVGFDPSLKPLIP